MILPDVNVLVYAYREEALEHDSYNAWLADVLVGPEDLALADHCVMGFLRIVTNPRIFEDPAPTSDALAFVHHLQRGHRARSITPSPSTWATLSSWVESDAKIKANLLPDAYLAALAVTNGCRLATADRGFGRFASLQFFDPLRPVQ